MKIIYNGEEWPNADDCADLLAQAKRELRAAIERAARAEAEVAHLRAALWLERHPEARPTMPTSPTSAP
jgi:hypothetical protein